MMTDFSSWVKILIQIGPLVIKSFQWVRNRIKWRGISENARKTAFAFNSFSWEHLQRSAPIINFVGLIERPEVDQIQRLWQSENIPIILHGEAGSGKSGIALRLGQTLTNEGIPVLFIKATDFTSGQDPVLTIQHRMPINTPLLEAVLTLSKERACATIIDQLDSIAGTDLCKNLVSFIRSLTALQNVKILIVSRTYELRHDPDISTLGFSEVESGQLTPEQAVSYLSQIGITAPSQAAIDLSRNLLNLSLIADTVKNCDVHDYVITDEVNLWQQYFLTIQQREGEEVAEYVSKLARETTPRGERTFPGQFPRAEFQRKLLSRSILMEVAGRRFAFRHEQLQDFLCAYSILPEQLNFSQVLQEFRGNISKNVISWLHKLYHSESPKIEAILIDDILSAKDILPFYSRIPILENLKKQLDSTEDSAEVIFKHSADWAYQRYFFDGLENPTWIPPLFAVGLFFQPPEPIETQPGYYQSTDWPAGVYLYHFADQYTNIVEAVIESSRTENPHVQEILIDAMMKIPPDQAAGLVAVVDRWLNSSFSDMLPAELIALTNHLVKNGLTTTAIQILEYVTTPVLSPVLGEYSKYSSVVRFRSDHYWVDEYCKKQIGRLIEREPSKVVSVFEKHLDKTIELALQADPTSGELQVGYYWRMDIPNRISELSDADATDIFVDGLRDGLAEVCRQSVDEGREFLEKYLNNEHVIYRRIALFTLRSFGQNYPDLVDHALSQQEYLDAMEYAKEYRGLMRDQFGNASDMVRAQVIRWILASPIDIEARAEWIAQSDRREVVIEEDRQKAREEWILPHLELIRDCLEGEALAYLDELVAIYGKPDITEKPAFIVHSWEETPSPVSAEELAEKSLVDLKQLFLDYDPDDSFMNSRESLGRTFQKLVSESPERFSAFATFLNNPAVRFVYIFHYLSGIREGVKNKIGKLTDGILALCTYIVEQKAAPSDKTTGDHEPGLLDAQIEVAHLLEEALHSDDPYLTREQLDLVRALLIDLVHHPDPETDADSQTSFDPFTHSLNCVRGEAMHGIIHYSLYLVRQHEKQSGRKQVPGYLEPEIIHILEERLDLEIEPSLAVHSVFGAFIPQLHYLSPDWVEANLIQILPEEIEKDAYWEAAWNAYIFASNAYRDIIRLLIPCYQRGLRLLNHPQVDQKQHFGGSPQKRLAQHIMFAYLAGLTDFAHDNLLLDLFFDNAPDEVRAQGIFWLRRVLGNDKPSSDNILWKKCWVLWQRRLEQAEAQEATQNSRELSGYMRWLEFTPAGLDILFPALQSSIKYLNNGFDVVKLSEYIAQQSDRFPLQAVTLLQQTIRAAKESWWAPDDKDEEQILRMAMGSGNEECIRIASDVINYRGEQGNFRWKYLLE